MRRPGDPKGSSKPHVVGKPRWKLGPRTRETLLPYGLLAPILGFEALFVIYPIVRGILLAFQTNNFGVTSYSGLTNFRQMLNDPIFWGSVRTTFEFTLTMVVVWLVLGLAFALLMNWSFKGRGVVRAILAIPWAIPDIPVILTFTIMLDPNFGILNRFAAWIPGVHHQIQWLSSSNLAFIAIVIMVAWKGFPFYALILLSSLQSIPDDLYEAARVDGAGAIRCFRSITLPALVPTLALLAILAFIFSFQQFSLIYLTTGGGPGTDTSTLAVLIYNQAFQFFNYNYASAIAVIALIFALLGTLLFVVFERKIIRSRYLEEKSTAL
ncbi:MAG: sugar transporter permease [Chloroflexi bacterium]|nr:sugar transporter permease [Chloroflexota bacterium]